MLSRGLECLLGGWSVFYGIGVFSTGLECFLGGLSVCQDGSIFHGRIPLGHVPATVSFRIEKTVL